MEAHDRIVVVTLLGRYGIDTPDIFPTIRAEPSCCAESLQRFDAIVFDLSKAQWVNSEGISITMLFIARFQQNRDVPRSIGFVHGDNPRHQRLLDAIGFTMVFDTFATLAEALQHYGQK